jgi:hypothetical protein
MSEEHAGDSLSLEEDTAKGGEEAQPVKQGDGHDENEVGVSPEEERQGAGSAGPDTSTTGGSAPAAP